MRKIGFRASPSEVVYAIINGADNEVVDIDQILIPKAFEVPDALKYVRGNVLDILREYDIGHAGIRVTEPNARQMSIHRIQIEGVVLEAFASSPLKSFYFGQISTIAARLGKKRSEIKPMLEAEEHADVERWSHLSTNEKEALLCAIGA